MPRFSLTSVLGAVLFVVAFVSVRTVSAVNFVVSNLNDSGIGSLRQAISDANANPGDDTIQVQSGIIGTIVVASELTISSNIGFTGPGAEIFSISGNSQTRVFNIASGSTVSISGVMVTRGRAQLGTCGGGILNAGDVTLTSVRVDNNSIPSNEGCGLGMANVGTMIVHTSTISNNTSIPTIGPVVQGGGVFNSGTLSINRSTISGNVARLGGGIFNTGTLLIESSTLFGNRAGSNTGTGGAIHGGVQLRNSTIANNTAGSASGAPGLMGGTLGNSVLSNNTRPGIMVPGESADVVGSVNSLGNNLVSGTTGSSGWVASDLLNINPRLAWLAMRGGPTATCALLPGSAALDSGNPTGAPAVDQRGRPRVAGVGIDIGAFERQNSDAILSPYDFDGDARTDISVYRPPVGEWWFARSGDGSVGATQFGADPDRPVPGDYTGDGKTDIAFWRPSAFTWFVLRSEDSSFYSTPFGAAGDTLVPADYDADGRVDLAVYRASTNTWIVNNSSGGTTFTIFGSAGDIPITADFDADRRSDIGIFRPSVGQWWLQRSSLGLIVFQFGTSTDKLVAGDHTGDQRADVAFWRPSTGEWFVLRSEDSSYYAFPFGLSSDVAAPGDYDGDGKIDAGIFRPSNSTWYLRTNLSGILTQKFGTSGDVPIPTLSVR